MFDILFLCFGAYIIFYFCQAQSQTELALLSLWYQQATQPPGIVSNSTSNVNQGIKTGRPPEVDLVPAIPTAP